ACPGRVVDVLQRKRRRAEHAAVGEQECTVFSLLDDQRRRTHLTYEFCCADEIGFARELTRLGIVDNEEIDVLERASQLVRRMLYPEIHRIADDELRTVHLLEHRPLNAG